MQTGEKGGWRRGVIPTEKGGEQLKAMIDF